MGEARQIMASTPRVVSSTEPEVIEPEGIVSGSAWAMVPRAQAELERKRAFDPHDFVEAGQIAEALWRSGLLPKNVDSPQAALAIIVQGRELGLSVMQSLRGLFLIDGRVCMSAQTMIGLVEQSGAAIYFRQIKSTDEESVWETHRHGHPEPITGSFSIEDARRAGLAGKAMWQKYPKQMLSWRAGAGLARTVYPDVVGGLYTPEELGVDEQRAAMRRTAPRERAREPARRQERRVAEPQHQEPPPEPKAAPAQPPPVEPSSPAPAATGRSEEINALKRDLARVVGDVEAAKQIWLSEVEPGPASGLAFRARAAIVAAKMRAEAAAEQSRVTTEDNEPPPPADVVDEPPPIDASAVCPVCESTGEAACKACDGKGKYTCPTCNGPNAGREFDGRCPQCDGWPGDGRVITCWRCKGSGKSPCKACPPPPQREPGAEG